MEIAQKIQVPFNDLAFEEKEHKYFVKGTPLKTSVSGLISKYYSKFDAEAIAPYSAKKLGISTEEVLQQWKDINQESRDRGHRVHTFGERYPYDRSLKPSCLQEEAIVKFWQELPSHIILVSVELRMYHFLHLFAGTADIILFDTIKQEYIIADYKTNKDLHKNYQGQTMLGPFQHLLDCPLNHYALQLSYYQILLEQIGVNVSQRVIVWLGLDGNYTLFTTEDLTNALKQTLN
jgi:ATP-dependent exoDNAse (exonuclease V) beta subunit